MALPKPKYNSYREDRDDQHFYRTNSSDTWFEGVTSVTGTMFDKIWAAPWGAKITGEYLIDLWRMNNGREVGEEELIKWLKAAKAEHRRISEEARDVGSALHIAIQNHLPVIEVPETIKNPLSAYYDWMRETDLEPLARELVVVSESENYGGTIDLVAENKQGIWIVDFKSSKIVDGSKEIVCQLGAYAQAFVEQYPVECPLNLLALRLAKDKPIYEEFHLRPTKDAVNAFQSVLKAYRILKTDFYSKGKTNKPKRGKQK